MVEQTLCLDRVIIANLLAIRHTRKGLQKGRVLFTYNTGCIIAISKRTSFCLIASLKSDETIITPLHRLYLMNSTFSLILGHRV